MSSLTEQILIEGRHMENYLPWVNTSVIVDIRIRLLVQTLTLLDKESVLPVAAAIKGEDLREGKELRIDDHSCVRIS